jgi:hypothetical protein
VSQALQLSPNCVIPLVSKLNRTAPPFLDSLLAQPQLLERIGACRVPLW